MNSENLLLTIAILSIAYSAIITMLYFAKSNKLKLAEAVMQHMEDDSKQVAQFLAESQSKEYSDEEL